ncbi:MAG: N-acetyl-gamma-glutamyl-phosphate reductase [Saprospiraceae bacterium]|nr:N-acetyl-gamma-glutamyl-phosphate reductase [Saprospiraceae bacterium]MDZ4705046.1 N-acetyl-gamma-glutamyl-phosphate reductase [Saprospiraceae bacterium]
MKIKAGIIGGAGYTGGEAIRLLLRHPQVELAFVHSRSNAGKPLHAAHPDLLGDTELHFTDRIEQEVDVLFLCLGHGESKRWLDVTSILSSVKIIDLSQDFRLGASVQGKVFTYGLPEVNRESIRQADNIANPGCFATAIELSLAPLAAAGLLQEVHTTGITGATGAGQKLQETTHFTWRTNNISAYKTLNHQHLHEIRRTLTQLQPGYEAPIHFIPWRGDFARGIFVSSCTPVAASFEALQQLYKEFYANHPFTQIADEPIDLKQVVNTNKCLLFLEKEGDQLVVHSTIDNLLKGASGQAVQNMNLMFGLEETAGLQLKSVVF